MNLVRQMLKYLPTLVLSLVLAIAVWISAVTSIDPVVEKTYPRSVEIEIIGQNPAMIVTSEDSKQLSLRISAPQSVWDKLVNDPIPVRGVVDLSGLGPGTHTLPVQVQIGILPTRI